MHRITGVSPLALTIALLASSAHAEGEVNLYSSRHYDTDERLYTDFEEATGITINRIEGNADELIARMQAEGANSPADVLLTVDTSRLERAKDAGVLQSIESAVLEERVPGNLQDSDDQWFGFSQRARIIFYDKTEMTEPPRTYADLADPRYAGEICIRSSTNTYNQTLLASIIEHAGEDAAKAWAQGVKDNMARDPQGGDTDQLRAVVSGECNIAVSNTYYFARALAGGVDGLSDSTDYDRLGLSGSEREWRARQSVGRWRRGPCAEPRERDCVSGIPRLGQRAESTLLRATMNTRWSKASRRPKPSISLARSRPTP